MKTRETLEKLNKMTVEELEKELDKVYVEARRDRLSVEARKSEDTAAVRNKRRYIARILTIINAKDRD